LEQGSQPEAHIDEQGVIQTRIAGPRAVIEGAVRAPLPLHQAANGDILELPSIE